MGIPDNIQVCYTRWPVRMLKVARLKVDWAAGVEVAAAAVQRRCMVACFLLA